jgi:hypothetical protein
MRILYSVTNDGRWFKLHLDDENKYALVKVDYMPSGGGEMSKYTKVTHENPGVLERYSREVHENFVEAYIIEEEVEEEEEEEEDKRSRKKRRLADDGKKKKGSGKKKKGSGKKKKGSGKKKKGSGKFNDGVKSTVRKWKKEEIRQLADTKTKAFFKRVRERSLKKRNVVRCNLSKRDREFFQMFIPNVFINDKILTKYDECEKISTYVLNKVLSSVSEEENLSRLIVRRKSDYVINDFIGNGSYGYVMNVLNRENDINYVLKLVAVKTSLVGKGGGKEEKKFLNFAEEVGVLKREFNIQSEISREFERSSVLKIPKVYRVKDMSKSNHLYGVLMEKIVGDEYKKFPLTFLKDHVPGGVDNWKHVSQQNLIVIIRGLNVLHKRGYVHGDVAYRNMMYREGDEVFGKEGMTRQLVLFDFGRSVKFSDVKNVYNQYLLKMYDYYSLLIEMSRNLPMNQFMYLADCLSKVITPILEGEFTGKNLSRDSYTDDERRLIYEFLLGFKITFTDTSVERREELKRRKFQLMFKLVKEDIFRPEEAYGGGEGNVSINYFWSSAEKKERGRKVI